MNDLLFYALILALLYYFFYYLPNQKKSIKPTPFTSTQTTQTEPGPSDTLNGPGVVNCPGPELTKEDNQALEQQLDNLIKNIQDLNKDLDTK